MLGARPEFGFFGQFDASRVVLESSAPNLGLGEWDHELVRFEFFKQVHESDDFPECSG